MVTALERLRCSYKFAPVKMEAKKRKRCSVRLMSKAKKSCTGIPQGVPTEDQKRIMEWIESQNMPKKGRRPIVDSHNSSEVNKALEHNADSLAELRRVKSEEVYKNVYFVCEWKDCLKECTSGEELHSHIRTHISELSPIRKKYNCLWDLCIFQTDCAEEVTRHIFYHAYHTTIKTFGESLAQIVSIPKCANDSRNRNTVPDLKTDFVCQWDDCRINFKAIRFFHEHVREHVSFERETIKIVKFKGPMTCKWNKCDKFFQNAYRLKEHLKMHISEKTVGCFHCGAIFSNNTNFFDHCKRQEAITGRIGHEFQCSECMKYYPSERLLRHHVLLHLNSHKCPVCEMTCNSQYQLAMHIRYRHITERPFHCSFCSYRAVSKSDLNIHALQKHKKKSLPCSVEGCKFVAKSLHYLRKHATEVHIKAVYICHCCDKEYKNGRSLSIHLKEEHKYQLLPGHRRFIYRLDEHGFYKLQTMRIESLEVMDQMPSPTNATSSSFDGFSLQMKESDECKPDLNVPFKVIATHDATVEEPAFPEKFEEEFEEKYDIEPTAIHSKDIIITFKEIDEEGNVIQSKCISGNEIELS